MSKFTVIATLAFICCALLPAISKEKSQPVYPPAFTATYVEKTKRMGSPPETSTFDVYSNGKGLVVEKHIVDGLPQQTVFDYAASKSYFVRDDEVSEGPPFPVLDPKELMNRPNAIALGPKKISGYPSHGFQAEEGVGAFHVVWIGDDTHYIVEDMGSRSFYNDTTTLKSWSDKPPPPGVFDLPELGITEPAATATPPPTKVCAKNYIQCALDQLDPWLNMIVLVAQLCAFVAGVTALFVGRRLLRANKPGYKKLFVLGGAVLIVALALGCVNSWR